MSRRLALDALAPEELNPEQRALLAAYWWRRAEGEMGAWYAFGYLHEDLTALGAPGPLVELARHGIDEERRHALWARDWALRFGHPDRGEPQPRSTRPLTFPGASARENRQLRIAFACLTETCGCVVLQDIRPRVLDPELRRLNQRHLADEVKHARVGWGHLATLSDDDRRLVRAWMPELLRVLPQAVCEGPESDFEELVGCGYFTPTVLRRAHERALREVIVPGLVHLELSEAA
jgi:hypothetical protein